MLAGRPPFQAANPMDTLLQVLEQDPAPLRTLNSKIPQDLETICLKCLRKGRERRYATSMELVADLKRWMNGEPIKARPVSRLEKAQLWCKRNPRFMLASAVVAATILIAGMYASCTRFQSRQRRTESLVTALEAADSAAVPLVIRALEDLPRSLVLRRLTNRYGEATGEPRLSLAYALAHFGQFEAETILAAIADEGTDPQEVMHIVSAAAPSRDEALLELRTAATSASADGRWPTKARLAIIAWHLGDTNLVREMLRAFPEPEAAPTNTWDPVQRTRFISEFAKWSGDLKSLAAGQP